MAFQNEIWEREKISIYRIIDIIIEFFSVGNWKIFTIIKLIIICSENYRIFEFQWNFFEFLINIWIEEKFNIQFFHVQFYEIGAFWRAFLINVVWFENFGRFFKELHWNLMDLQPSVIATAIVLSLLWIIFNDQNFSLLNLHQ